MKSLRGQADLFVVLSHQGLEADQKLAKAVPGIHLIVGAHTQSFLQEPIQVGETWIVQASFRNQQVGAWKIGDKKLRKELLEYFELQWRDTVNARVWDEHDAERRVEGDAPAVGDAVYADDKDVGRVTSAAPSVTLPGRAVALAMVRQPVIEAGAAVTVNGARATLTLRPVP